MKEITTVKKFIGTSAETKPTSSDTKGLHTGSTFFETDTGLMYVYTGSAWAIKTTPVLVNGSLVESVTFHNAATTAADGTALTVGGLKTLTVEIYGTSTSRTVEFKGAGPEGTYRAITGVNMATLATAISTTGTAELWQFDISGLVSVIMDLSAVAGGNVTVKGRAVA